MDDFDLMAFNSPEQSIKENECDTQSRQSPGDNPFDLLSNHANLQFVEDLKDLEYFARGNEMISGKESLGILKLEAMNTSDNFLIEPKDKVVNRDSKLVVSNSLNVAYLQLPSFRGSSKTGSGSSASRFNSGSLEASILSNICSVDFEYSNNVFNEAFLKSKCEQRPKSLCKVSPVAKVNGKRALSLPDFGRISSDCNPSDSKEVKLGDSLDDSVFIEANNLASQIANTSIQLNDACIQELSLDCVSPPKLIDLDEMDHSTNADAESVFKKVDTLLPPKEKETDNVLLTDEASHKEEVKKNLTDIFSNVERRRSRSTSSSSGSNRDPNEILSSLSAIINNGRRDSKQNQEGQQLLYNLADILCSENVSNSQCENLDDSGHSSIDQDEQNGPDEHACFEVLDLRVVSKSIDDMPALDLSTKSKCDSGRRLSQSFTLPSSPKLFNRLKSQSTSGSSIASSKLGSSRNDSNKLKPKKIEDKMKHAKGPLKAVIPVMDMAKRKSAVVTPPKFTGSSIFTTKRTSTPVIEPHVKPVAQSTPSIRSINVDCAKPNSCSSQLRKRKFYCPISPLVQQNSVDKSLELNSTKSSQSASTPNLSSQSRKDSIIPSPKSLSRRHSATELKDTVSKPPIKRSYSIGSGNKPNIVNKLKKTVTTITNTSLKKNTLLPLQKSSQNDSNSGSIKNVKPSGLLGKFRHSKSNKENCPRK